MIPLKIRFVNNNFNIFMYFYSFIFAIILPFPPFSPSFCCLRSKAGRPHQFPALSWVKAFFFASRRLGLRSGSLYAGECASKVKCVFLCRRRQLMLQCSKSSPIERKKRLYCSSPDQ